MTELNKLSKPPLPAEFFRPVPGWVALNFLYSALLYVGFGYCAHAVATNDWALAAKLPIVSLTALLASNGLHLFGWLAHEGIHLSLARNKTVSVALGSLAGSVLLFSAIGFGISHWPHHRFTNDERDPDTALQSRQQTFWRRFFLARIFANRQYTRDAIALLLRKPRSSSYRMPFSERSLWLLNVMGLTLMALFLGFYIVVAFWHPMYALYALLLPYLCLIPTTGLRIYIEHAGTEVGEFRDARSYMSPVYTALLFGNNYHLEHHLYPSVPAYKLPLVHRKLVAEGYYECFQSRIVDGIAAPFRYTLSAYPYPDAALIAMRARPAGSAAAQTGSAGNA